MSWSRPSRRIKLRLWISQLYRLTSRRLAVWPQPPILAGVEPTQGWVIMLSQNKPKGPRSMRHALNRTKTTGVPATQLEDASVKSWLQLSFKKRRWKLKLSHRNLSLWGSRIISTTTIQYVRATTLRWWPLVLEAGHRLLHSYLLGPGIILSCCRHKFRSILTKLGVTRQLSQARPLRDKAYSVKKHSRSRWHQEGWKLRISSNLLQMFQSRGKSYLWSSLAICSLIGRSISHNIRVLSTNRRLRYLKRLRKKPTKLPWSPNQGTIQRPTVQSDLWRTLSPLQDRDQWKARNRVHSRILSHNHKW